ncbi:hypothetical protein SDJN02_01806, partial [Cucurbita argyrosperma subsp. argyrosperma]
MIWNIKSLVDRLKEGVKEAVETAIEERLTNSKDIQRRERRRRRAGNYMEGPALPAREFNNLRTKTITSYIMNFVVNRILYIDPQYKMAEIERQELQLRLEREAFEKEKGLHNGGTASTQNNQDGALEITVGGERYRCLRYPKPKK